MMIASALHLDRQAIKRLKIKDEYSLHRVVYSLFEDIRSSEQKQTGVSSGILYADKGGDKTHRKILMLSNRQPNIPEQGEISSKKIADNFLDYQSYRFEVVVNPSFRDNKTRKIMGLPKPDDKEKNKSAFRRKQLSEWFIEKSEKNWGFITSPEYLEIHEIEFKQFKKGNYDIKQVQAKVLGRLTVTDKEKFIKSFQQGIGRGKAFGCGLLQIVPL